MSPRQERNLGASITHAKREDRTPSDLVLLAILRWETKLLIHRLLQTLKHEQYLTRLCAVAHEMVHLL